MVFGNCICGKMYLRRCFGAAGLGRLYLRRIGVPSKSFNVCTEHNDGCLGFTKVVKGREIYQYQRW
jgi:hypothetical protein